MVYYGHIGPMDRTTANGCRALIAAAGLALTGIEAAAPRGPKTVVTARGAYALSSQHTRRALRRLPSLYNRRS